MTKCLITHEAIWANQLPSEWPVAKSSYFLLFFRYLDIENLEEKFHSLEEWDYNIKVIRAKRKELEKLQDLYKVSLEEKNKKFKIEF